MSYIFIDLHNILYWEAQAIDRGYRISPARYDVELFRAIKDNHTIVFYRRTG